VVIVAQKETATSQLHVEEEVRGCYMMTKDSRKVEDAGEVLVRALN